MNEIPVQYFLNNQPYRLNGDYFDQNHVQSITLQLQKVYMPFAEKINSQNGVLAIHLSHPNNDFSTIRHYSEITGISKELEIEIGKTVNPK